MKVGLEQSARKSTPKAMNRTSLKLDKFRKHWIITWCKQCKDSTFHNPLKIHHGRWALQRKTMYKCTVCGELRSF